MTAPESLSFSVDGQLIGELGERLVTRNHVALSELIKNGYDADATSIQVEFCTLSNKLGKSVATIIIKDDGQGMTFAEVKEYWMRIATANKQSNKVSKKFGRPRTGSKGIGRFSCQRLAEELVLITTTASGNSFNQVTVNFNWADFKPGTNLTDIPCTYKRKRVNNGKSGTTLQLIGLRDAWTDRDYNTLRRSVATLAFTQETERYGYDSDVGLSIQLEGPNFKSESGNLFENIIESGWGRMRGSVDQSGCVILKLEGKYLGSQRRYKSKPLYHEFKNLDFDVSYYVAQESYYMNRNTTLLKKSVLNELRSEAGVRVYFERFRVFSLGESGDDWLRLDRDYAARKSSITNEAIRDIVSSLGLNVRDVALVRPRNENLVGRVFLTKQHEKYLQIKMNREGFVDTAGFRKLSELIRFSIEWMGTHYAYAKDVHTRNETREAEREFSDSLSKNSHSDEDNQAPPLRQAIAFLAKAASVNSYPSKNKTNQLADNIDQAKRVIELNYRDLDTELSILRTLASTAPLLFTFSHEVHALIGRLDTHASLIRGITQKVHDEKDKARLMDMAGDLIKTSSQFRQLSSLFGIIADTKASSPKRHYIKPLLDNLIQGTRFTTENSNISVAVDCTEDLKTPRMRKSEFISIVINLYTNALKSTIANNGDRISVNCSKRDANLFIEILDTGVGLTKKYRKDVLNPFSSDPENKIYRKLEDRIGGTIVSSLGKGTGLGLSIVGGIIKAYKGNLEFFDSPPWSIGVRVTLPG